MQHSGDAEWYHLLLFIECFIRDAAKVASPRLTAFALLGYSWYYFLVREEISVLPSHKVSKPAHIAV